MFEDADIELDPVLPPTPEALKRICFFIQEVLTSDYHLNEPAITCRYMPPESIKKDDMDEKDDTPRYGIIFHPEDDVDPCTGSHVDTFIDDLEAAFNDITEHPRKSMLNGSVSFPEIGDRIYVSNLEDIVTILERLSEMSIGDKPMKKHFWNMPDRHYTLDHLRSVIETHYKNGGDALRSSGPFEPGKTGSAPVFNRLAAERAARTEEPLPEEMPEKPVRDADESDAINLWVETFIEEAMAADYTINVSNVSIWNHSQTGRVMINIDYLGCDDAEMNAHDQKQLETFLLHLTDARFEIRKREFQENGGPVEMRIEVDEKNQLVMAKSLEDILDILSVLSEARALEWDKPAYLAKKAPMPEDFTLTQALRLKAETILAIKPELIDSISCTDGFSSRDDMLKEILRFNALIEADAGPFRTHTLDELQRAIESHNAVMGSTRRPYYQTNAYGYAQ